MRRFQPLPKLLPVLPVALLLAGTALWIPRTAHAAGSAAFSLSPGSATYTVGSSFTVNVYETSQVSDNVSGVQANLSYPTATLQCNSVSVSGTPFTFLGQATCSGGLVSIGEAAAAPVSGQQFVGAISFTVIGPATQGTTVNGSVAITTGSDIKNDSNASVWNGVNASATYTLKNPAATTGGGGGTGGSGGGTTGGGGSSGGSSGGSASSGSTGGGSSTGGSTGTTAPTAPVTTAPTSPTTTPTTTPPPATAALTITVTDKQGKPISKAKVVIDDRYSEYTDAKGQAGFSGLPSGTHSVTVSGTGKTTTQTTLQLTDNETKQVSLKLAAKTSPVVLVVAAVAGLLILGGGAAGYLRLKSGKSHAFFPAIQMGPVVVGSETGVVRTQVEGRVVRPTAEDQDKPSSDESHHSPL